jgi:hypothetical protein
VKHGARDGRRAVELSRFLYGAVDATMQPRAPRHACVGGDVSPHPQGFMARREHNGSGCRDAKPMCCAMERACEGMRHLAGEGRRSRLRSCFGALRDASRPVQTMSNMRGSSVRCERRCATKELSEVKEGSAAAGRGPRPGYPDRACRWSVGSPDCVTLDRVLPLVSLPLRPVQANSCYARRKRSGRSSG